MTREAPTGERASTGRGRHRLGHLGAVALVVAFLAVLVYGFSTTALDDQIDRALAEGRTSPAPGFSLEDVATAYGATGIPETFFVDERGRVVGHVVGAVSDRPRLGPIPAPPAGTIPTPGVGILYSCASFR